MTNEKYIVVNGVSIHMTDDGYFHLSSIHKASNKDERWSGDKFINSNMVKELIREYERTHDGYACVYISPNDIDWEIYVCRELAMFYVSAVGEDFKQKFHSALERLATEQSQKECHSAGAEKKLPPQCPNLFCTSTPIRLGYRVYTPLEKKIKEVCRLLPLSVRDKQAHKTEPIHYSFTGIDIANAMIKRANQLQINDLNHLKLQKLLYYVLAKYFKVNNKRLITENICKWQYGAVVLSVYHQYKYFSQHFITEPLTYLDDSSNYLDPTKKFFIKFVDIEEIQSMIEKRKDIVDVIEFVLKKLGNLKPFELVDRIYHEKSWNNGSDEYYTDNDLLGANI